MNLFIIHVWDDRNEENDQAYAVAAHDMEEAIDIAREIYQSEHESVESMFINMENSFEVTVARGKIRSYEVALI